MSCIMILHMYIPPSLDMRTVAIPLVMLASGEVLLMDSFIVSSLSTRSEERMVILRQPLFVPGIMSIVEVSTVKSSPSVWTTSKHNNKSLYVQGCLQWNTIPLYGTVHNTIYKISL